MKRSLLIGLLSVLGIASCGCSSKPIFAEPKTMSTAKADKIAEDFLKQLDAMPPADRAAYLQKNRPGLKEAGQDASPAVKAEISAEVKKISRGAN